MKHIVGFSGGIDSQACAGWVLDRFPKEDVILMNSTAGGNEHPLTTEHVAWYSANVHPVVVVDALVRDLWRTPGWAETRGLDGNAVMTFGDMIKIKGRPPSRTNQFCTAFLKLYPTKRWMEENLSPTEEYIRYSGVRRDESHARRNTEDEQHDEFYDCPLRHPIAAWSKQECFAFVKSRGERVNPLYALGFDRVGCAPCINSGKDDIRNWALRFPEMIDKVRRWEHESGRTFFPPIVTPPTGRGVNTIDEVVNWAMTERGGRQYSLAVVTPTKACDSNWGLCE